MYLLMEKYDIPRLEIETFAKESYKVPVLQVRYHPLDAGWFIIENRELYPITDYISPNRREFYKIFHMTGGTGILTIGLHRYEVGPGDIAFLHPDEIMSWQSTSRQTGGYFCLIHPNYFGHDLDHVQLLLRRYPHLKPSRAVVRLNPEQSQAIDHFFSVIYREARGSNEDKRQAIVLHLQLLLLEAQRAGRVATGVEATESYGYIYGFLSLLESSFHIRQKDSLVRIRNASEFAEQLNVHPNYLNALVKEHTGKTLREHIQERLLYEAKTLLVQTDWDINSIGYSLGFSGHAAFTTFFKKKAQISPSTFRKNRVGVDQID